MQNKKPNTKQALEHLMNILEIDPSLTAKDIEEEEVIFTIDTCTYM